MIPGIEILPFGKPVVEGDRLNLTCRSRNIDGNAALMWQWTPHYTPEGILSNQTATVILNKTIIQSI